MRSITSAEVLVVDDSLTNAELTIHALKIGEVMPTAIDGSPVLMRRCSICSAPNTTRIATQFRRA